MLGARAAEAKVEPLVKPCSAAVLQDGVLAGDAHIGSTVLHVGGHVGAAHDDELVTTGGFEHQRAWHAGVSCFEGRERCNDFSIGIELEGCDDEAYQPAQYSQLVEVVMSLMEAYPGITPARIVGHSDIAPGRKTDPGPAFDWDCFRQRLAGGLS